MLSARLCQVALANPYVKTYPLLKTAVTVKSVNLLKSPFSRNNEVRRFVFNGREKMSHTARRRTLREQALAPAGETAFDIGKGAVAGGAALALGALCYYGLGLSSQPGSLEKSVLWPKYVKDRIRDTYMYFGGSILVSVASAAAVFRSPVALELVSRGGFLPMVLTLGGLIVTGMIVQSIPYSPGFGVKQIAWLGHSAMIGALLAPMAFLGGPLLVKAAWYTAGIVGGLSTVAVCAPSEKFLGIAGPLAIGLGVVFASSIGSMFLPPTTALGAGLYSVALYGGLLVFSGLLLYDTQRIINAAEKYPPPQSGMRPFDPVNMSVSIYLDVVNIFIRVATILAGGGSGGNRKH